MNLSDTFYIALCMTVLILGVVYWFWTQNQYMQRKMNLLENIVYEMKSTMGTGPPDGFEPAGHGVSASPSLQESMPTEYPPAPSSVLGDDEDLLHEELHTAVTEEDDGIPQMVESMPEEEEDDGINAEALTDDLQPGGVGSGDVKEINATTTSSSVLDGLTLKQLKTLASQHNISGATGMRKHELITALRAKIPTDATF